MSAIQDLVAETLDMQRGQKKSETGIDHLERNDFIIRKQVADRFVWLASTLGRFNANELRRADHEVHNIADGRYDGRIQKYQQGLTR